MCIYCGDTYGQKVAPVKNAGKKVHCEFCGSDALTVAMFPDEHWCAAKKEYAFHNGLGGVLADYPAHWIAATQIIAQYAEEKEVEDGTWVWCLFCNKNHPQAFVCPNTPDTCTYCGDILINAALHTCPQKKANDAANIEFDWNSIVMDNVVTAKEEPWAEEATLCPHCGNTHVPSYVCPEQKPCCDYHAQGWFGHTSKCPNKKKTRRSYVRSVLLKNGLGVAEAVNATKHLSAEEFRTNAEWDKEYSDADL